jgi:23S rRNA pseudoU1915 N3-methylase RlmH
VKIICPSKPKEPYRELLRELSLRAGVPIKWVKEVPKGDHVVLDEDGEPLTPEVARQLVRDDADIVVGGPDGTDAQGRRLSLGPYTLNHFLAIAVLLDLLFRAKNPTHPYNKH